MLTKCAPKCMAFEGGDYPVDNIFGSPLPDSVTIII